MNRREFCFLTGKLLTGVGFLTGTLPCRALGAVAPGNPRLVAAAINGLGLDLLYNTASARENALLSPFSIQAAFAMTWAGADGATHAEMAKVLRYPSNETDLHSSFMVLIESLDTIAERSRVAAEDARKLGAVEDPIKLAIANRLFGKEGYKFRPAFLRTTKEIYKAPLQLANFSKNPDGERKKINAWVEDQTSNRIKDLVPPEGINALTTLVLVNAIYFKAPWAHAFQQSQTKPAPFHLENGEKKDVPTMQQLRSFGYARKDGYTAITLPYSDNDLQLLILLPDAPQPLASFQKKVTPELLTRCATPPLQELRLFLPKFKMAPDVLRLRKVLQELGMKTAFDMPPGSANFDRMAPRTPDDYLSISEAFHKTFMELDEKGTEAAAATAVVMTRTSASIVKNKPIEVRIDRPFLFAIQHRPTGACLFLGRLQNPT